MPLLLILLACPALPAAQSAEELRGGWIVDRMGTRHIYYIVLRDDEVSGFYCHDCEEPRNLAFIDDGALDEDGLRFAVYHYPADADAYRERVEARLIDGELALTITGPGGDTRELVVHRTRPEDAVQVPPPDASPNAQVGPGFADRERVLPGAPEIVTADDVVGSWLWGTGPGKQYFVFREHKGGIRGMVCGPCNSAPDMAPLEGVAMNGTSLHFEIVHEDNGIGFEEHGPHSNVTDARISKHEMHLSVVPSFEEPGFTPIEMTLLGPVETD